ncbi:MAG: HPP family protein [Anaerolineae bacterium]
MKVSQAMKRDVVSAAPEMTILEGAQLIVQHKIGTLPIITPGGRLVGVVTISDLLGAFIPDYFDMLETMRFVHDFGALEDFLPKDFSAIAHKSLRTIMKPPLAVEADASILRAATRMIRQNAIDLPVIDHNYNLVGLVSHVDIGTRFLQEWIETRKGSGE